MAYFHALPNHASLHNSNSKHSNYTSSSSSSYDSNSNHSTNSTNSNYNSNYGTNSNSINYHYHHNYSHNHNHIRNSNSQPVAFNYLYSFGHPAFTEAAFVSCPSDAALKSVRRLSYEGHLDQDYWVDAGNCSSALAMDNDAGAPALQRSTSHQSNASAKSSRSQTMRATRKYTSYMSSSASSISDKSLTSFPSFSPESPRNERPLLSQAVRDSSSTSRHPSIVESLTASFPSKQERTALFGDAPPTTRRVPGAIHNASDEHIERLIARTGAVALVRQIAEDLAQRDAEVAPLRRKAENRERALRKIILECGLSSLDLETRLRTIEAEQRVIGDNVMEADLAPQEGGLEDLMSDAMSQTVVLGERAYPDNDNTIRARDALQALEDRPITVARGWKDYIWGGTSRKSSRSSVVTPDIVNGLEPTKTRNSSATGRRTVLENGLFEAPGSIRSPSRASSIQSTHVNNSHRDRKPSSSFAALALKLVAGSSTTARDTESANGRGRSNSTGAATASRDQSSASTRTTMSARPAPVKQPPKAIPKPRRPAAISVQSGAIRGAQERWDTMGQSPQNTRTRSADNFGPVEMDQILPPDAQPPTLTHIYNAYSQEYLTDRFGFIYDQRRKKRQKEAAEKVIKSKRGSRVEMLNTSRGGRSPGITDDEGEMDEERPDTPTSFDERGEDGKRTKRWQDYLKIATFPTELLSHTPSGAEPAFEVMEGGEVPRSPRIIPEERGFLPSSNTTAASPSVPVTSGNATISKPDTSSPSIPLTTEDMEPVKLLLQQLGEVHDSLQREKTVRWNEFLRKVRAERKRDGEAAAAALAATGDKNTRPIAIMPEAVLADGEMIGVAGLGNKGKVGRAKWNEFKALVLGGIPVAYRAKIWFECSGAAALRIPGYYDGLVAHRGDEDDPAIIAQIQMDINRTLTDNIFFRKGPGVAKLEEVLLAYSRRNAEVGYCQGMNLITACLLLIMPTAEDAFWVLTSIIETILPQGYYDHSLLASRADQQVLRQYVAEILPKLSTHLDDLSIELEALTFQWFLSVFTDCLSAEALFRVWDVVLCTNDGSTFLFQVALALLKLNEQQLLQCSTPANIYTYINHQMTNHAISIDGLIHASEGLRKVVKRDEVEIRRAKAIESEKDLVRQREARNVLRKAERLAAANSSITADIQPEVDGMKTPPLENGTQLGPRGDEFGELSARTPTPAEEEAVLGMG
ncbi:Ypt of gyp1p [Venustampulla echinocandica]|uniref:Ypt of gyp1p n=1 Tax=Venustampulla echinocandica TaxID=2656787 RepID=A0A370TNZ9_9HELO|nr:Ypt of gyp1p [Venustampulla echinocandica]RDL37243.1 Ypt of gyp1p [Venustampulla echinocandica]